MSAIQALNPVQAAEGLSVYCIIKQQRGAVGGAFAILPFAPTYESLFLQLVGIFFFFLPCLFSEMCRVTWRDTRQEPRSPF